jgi:hypothetical protein
MGCGDATGVRVEGRIGALVKALTIMGCWELDEPGLE